VAYITPPPPKWQPRQKSGTPKPTQVNFPALSFLTPKVSGTGGVQPDPSHLIQLAMDQCPTCKRFWVKSMPGMHITHPP